MKQMVATEQIEGIKTDQQTIDLVNQAIASGQIQAGGDLYLHSITFNHTITIAGSGRSFTHEVRIYNTDPTPFTNESFYNYLLEYLSSLNEGQSQYSPLSQYFFIMTRCESFKNNDNINIFSYGRYYKSVSSKVLNFQYLFDKITITLSEGTITTNLGSTSDTITLSSFNSQWFNAFKDTVIKV